MRLARVLHASGDVPGSSQAAAWRSCGKAATTDSEFRLRRVVRQPTLRRTRIVEARTQAHAPRQSRRLCARHRRAAHQAPLHLHRRFSRRGPAGRPRRRRAVGPSARRAPARLRRPCPRHRDRARGARRSDRDRAHARPGGHPDLDDLARRRWCVRPAAHRERQHRVRRCRRSVPPSRARCDRARVPVAQRPGPGRRVHHASGRHRSARPRSSVRSGGHRRVPAPRSWLPPGPGRGHRGRRPRVGGTGSQEPECRVSGHRRVRTPI